MGLVFKAWIQIFSFRFSHFLISTIARRNRQRYYPQPKKREFSGVFLRSKAFSGQKYYKSNLLAGSIVAVSDRVGFALFGLSCGFDLHEKCIIRRGGDARVIAWCKDARDQQDIAEHRSVKCSAWNLTAPKDGAKRVGGSEGGECVRERTCGATRGRTGVARSNCGQNSTWYCW